MPARAPATASRTTPSRRLPFTTDADEQAPSEGASSRRVSALGTAHLAEARAEGSEEIRRVGDAAGDRRGCQSERGRAGLTSPRGTSSAKLAFALARRAAACRRLLAKRARNPRSLLAEGGCSSQARTVVCYRQKA